MITYRCVARRKRSSPCTVSNSFPYFYTTFTDIVDVIGQKSSYLEAKAQTSFYDPDLKPPVKPMPTGLEDMVNIMLSVNYLSGFSEYLQSAKAKLEPIDDNQAEEDSEISTISEDEDSRNTSMPSRKLSSMVLPRVSQTSAKTLIALDNDSRSTA